MTQKHSFHIPVMGLGFTVDTPLKVSQFGIDSVISIVDDILIERMRKMYCNKFKISYSEISDKIEDFRAKRITSYLNLINDLVENKFEEFKNSTIKKGYDIKNYFNQLPDYSIIKQEFNKINTKNSSLKEIKNWINDNFSMGSIDVNIMTKLDKENYFKGKKLSSEFNDAHAALRGFANSNLKSSIILSAGMNPRLYSYIEQFDDFYPNENGKIKKKLVLKVSDYRSALIQGKFLAKKGIWVSEFRIESGLNCGGHAFATDGYLLGPILSEFKDNKEKLAQSIYDVLVPALTAKNRTIPLTTLPLIITAQGGVGTAEEHNFLLNHYNVDSVGWGTPFLLVPEATTVDNKTLGILMKAKEEDLYLSNISPLGVPFNNVRGNTKDIEKLTKAKYGKPGSPCPEGFLSSNKEFTEKSICTASRQYQRKKIKDLDNENLSPKQYKSLYEKIIVKSCLCVGLSASALTVNKIECKDSDKVSICPGPNLAYFSKLSSLSEMVDHIYGRTNVITNTNRPNLFIKELNLYLDYLSTKIEDAKSDMTKKQEKYLLTFSKNLDEGINYYHNLFSNLKGRFEDTKSRFFDELAISKDVLQQLHLKIEDLSLQLVVAK
ncbi:MAG: hypothetical protein L3J08_06160 [Flavobacteriaceae bacterium]|nr:hypothetical protein [Flavobacteriaceae bacterium]